MSKKEKDTIIAKMKLWCVLNNFDLNNYFSDEPTEPSRMPCNICPNLTEDDLCAMEKRLWIHRDTLEFKIVTWKRIKQLHCISQTSPWRCVEWVNHV